MRRVLLAVIALICVAVIAVVLQSRRDKAVLPSTPAPVSRTPNTQVPQAVPAVSLQAPARKPPIVSPAVSAKVAPAVPDWPNLPAAIRLICGQDTNKSYMARITAAHQLGRNLSAAEIQALYWLLRQKCASQGDLNQESFAALKNDILDALIRQQSMPPDLGREIVGMYRDHSTDPLWRDYCVQHFAAYYERMWPAAAPDDPDRKDILAAFDEALQERDNDIAGAALLGLYGLSGKCTEADAVGDKALAMAKDGACAAQTRVTAVAVCGLTGKAEILPEARILAQTAEVLPLRLASIAAIGSLGTQQDKELLAGLRAGPDERLYKAVDAALKKLNQRTPGP
jgi:hypothetical protein